MNSLANELRGNFAFPAVHKPPPKKRPEITRKKITNMDRFYNLSKKGLTCEEISEKTGFHLKTVQRYLRWRRLAR